MLLPLIVRDHCPLELCEEGAHGRGLGWCNGCGEEELRATVAVGVLEER